MKGSQYHSIMGTLFVILMYHSFDSKKGFYTFLILSFFNFALMIADVISEDKSDSSAKEKPPLIY